MPDPSYVIETQGRKAGLEFHLQTAFYPPIPPRFRSLFIEIFTRYWDFDIDVAELSQQLKEQAGYSGSLGDYNFWQFLNDEDLED